jgi:hypothetical protein
MESKDDKSGLTLAAEKRIELLAADLGIAQGAVEGAPPILIASDGTPGGTHLMLHGELITATRISLYCSNNPDYPHCDLSITIEESGEDGMTIEKTLTLRKEPPSEVKGL